MDEGDILRIAAYLLAEHGEKAIIVARERAKALLRLGDGDASESWLKIVAAIEELSRDAPGPDELLH